MTKIKNIAVLTKNHLNLDVRIGYPDTSKIVKVEESMNTPIYATSIGLLLIGLNKLQHKASDGVSGAASYNKKKKRSLKSFLQTLFDN